MAALSRPAVAEWAGLTMTQIDYLAKLGVTAPDVGGHRKRFSLGEARLVVIAGCAIANGISPRVLGGPISWLRNYVLWPKEIELPEMISERIIEIQADDYGPFADCDNPDVSAETRDISVKYVASTIYSVIHAKDPLSLSENDRIELFEKAKKEEESAGSPTVDMKSGPSAGTGNEGASAVQRAIKQAKKLLDSRPQRDREMRERLRWCRDFELACLGKRDFFISLVARESGDEPDWKIRIDTSAVRIETEHAWLAIDVRRLFGDRTAIT